MNPDKHHHQGPTEMKTSTRMFPIMDGPSVPYEVMVPHGAQCQKNHYQSLDRVAERGGLSCVEAWCVINGMDWISMHRTSHSGESRVGWIAFAERVNLHYAELEEIRSIVAEFGYPIGTTAENLRRHIAYTTGEIKRLREGEKRAEAYMAKLQAMIPIERRVELAKEMVSKEVPSKPNITAPDLRQTIALLREFHDCCTHGSGMDERISKDVARLQALCEKEQPK